MIWFFARFALSLWHHLNEINHDGLFQPGMRGGGAAATAHRCFGAVWGKGVGLYGQSYAIPTMHFE